MPLNYKVSDVMKEDKIVKKVTPYIVKTLETGKNLDIKFDTVLESSSPLKIKSPTPSPSPEYTPSPIHNISLYL